MIEIVAAFLRFAVDEADEVDAVFWVLEEFVRDRLPDIAGSKDHRVLHVTRASSS